MIFHWFARSRRKAFTFTEFLVGAEGLFKAHSCGNGRFIQGAPSLDLDICFSLHKNKNSLNIQIHEDKLLQWLRAIPSLYEHFEYNLKPDPVMVFISMDRLLPYYEEMRAKFDQDRSEGHSFEALELFVRHFLREGSVFAAIGLEHLHEEQILTEDHFHDIQGPGRSIFESLDLLDEAIDEIDRWDNKGPTQSLHFMNERFQSQLRTAVRRHDSISVDKVLPMDLGFVDARTLCLAIRHYERTIFHRLLRHGAEVNGVGIIDEPLYRAAKAGHMEAVQLLLIHGANKEGGGSRISATPLSGAASGGHLEIVKYLVEEKGANINGNTYITPLARAIKYRHIDIIDYLLRVGANIHDENCSVLLKLERAIPGDIREHIIDGMDNDAHNLLFSRALSEGHLEIVRCLVAAGVDVNLDKRHYNANRDYQGSLCCSRTHLSPLAVAASKGYLEIVRCLVKAGAIINPSTRHRDTSNGDNSIMKDYNSILKDLWCTRGHCSPLAAALRSNESEVARFLSSVGATLLVGEGDMCLIRRPVSVGDFRKIIKDPARDCPALAAIQAQEHRIMARRLLKKVANSCEKLLDASTTQDASVGVIAFADQVGTSASVWRSGTRAIRDICECYPTPSLSDIVSALQVADAMRSVVSPSRLGCSMEAFIDDIPRWASFVNPDDQYLFFEIASYLWRIPASTVVSEMVNSLARPLLSLQDMVTHLVRISGLFDLGSEKSWRLQTLRHKHIFEKTPTHTISPSPMTTATPGLTTMGTSGPGQQSPETHENPSSRDYTRPPPSNIQLPLRLWDE
ncbi:ankyrin repeat-containing domain protein [Trichoderma camerunense]